MTAQASDSVESASAAWPRVRAYIQQRFPLARAESASAVRFVAVVGGQRIGLRLRSTVAYDRATVVVTAELGVADCLDPSLALVANGQLVAGALAIDQHCLVLRCLVDDEVQLAAALDLFIREAATLRSHLFIPPRGADLYTHFAD